MSAAALVLIQAIAADPAMAAAVDARRAGRTAEAVASFERLAQGRPGDADVWLNLGLSYMSAKRWSDADRALENTLRLSPAYSDARLAYARSAYFAGDVSAARTRLQPLLEAEPSNAEALDLRRRLDAPQDPAAADMPWRLDVSHSESWLTEGLGQWRATSLGVGRRIGRDSVAAAIEQTERFGDEDVYLEAAFSHRLGESDVFVSLGGAPDADYRPEISARLGGSIPLASRGAWRVRLGGEAVWQRYPVGNVRGLHPFLVVARPGFDFTVRSINTFDERDEYRSGYTLRASYAPAPRLTLFAAWADAPESSLGVTVDVRAASIGASIELNDATSLRLDYTREDRRAYDRDEAAVALTRRF